MRKLQFPGLTNTWTMPIENRLDMELTGIKTPVGLKIQGPSLDGIQQARTEDSTDPRALFPRCDPYSRSVSPRDST